MTANNDGLAEDSAPTELDILCGVIVHFFPERSIPWPRRRINIGEDHYPGAIALEAATSALADATANSFVDADVALKLLDAIEPLGRAGVGIDALRARVIAHVERRWSFFAEPLAACAVETYQRSSIFRDFPGLRRDPVLLARLAASIASRQSYAFRLEELLDELAPKTLAEARLLVVALIERGNCDGREYLALKTSLFCALGRGMGWTPWVSLQAILHARPGYADLHAAFERKGDRSKELSGDDRSAY